MLRTLPILTLLVLSACASAPPAANAIDAIEIREGACYGTCPIYTIRITPDDRYRLDGERFTRADGISQGQLPPGHFDRLADYIAAHDLMAFPADITPGNPAACGEGRVSDLPDFQLTVVLAERIKVIHWYPGCFGSSYRNDMVAARAAFRDTIGYQTLIARE